jgi:DNA processing protein
MLVPPLLPQPPAPLPSAPLPLASDELHAWLRLACARGLKPAALRALLGAFGLPQ